MHRLGCFCSIVLLLAGEAQGQSAHRHSPTPSFPFPDAAWSAVVTEFAQALVANDPGAIAPLLSDAANIHSLSGRTSDALRLLASARQSQLIFARGYVHSPPSAAGDIAHAFRDAPVPEDVKHMMIPLDEPEFRRANATAALWLTESLGATPGERVAIIVLWSANGRGEESDRPTDGISFVLLKGTPATSEARIQIIVFGKPLPY
jgi:hypothetical protein